MKRPAFETSAETEAIIDRVRRANIGELITYAQILDLTGFRSVNQARPYIASARRQLWSEHIHIRTERGGGLLRINGDDAVDVTQRREERLVRARRRLRRDWRDIIDASADKLAIRTRELYKHEMLNAMDQLFRRPEMRRLPENRPVLDPHKVIELFKQKLG